MKVFAKLIELSPYQYDGIDLEISFPNDIHSHDVIFHAIPNATYDEVCTITASLVIILSQYHQ